MVLIKVIKHYFTTVLACEENIKQRQYRTKLEEGINSCHMKKTYMAKHRAMKCVCKSGNGTRGNLDNSYETIFCSWVVSVIL